MYNLACEAQNLKIRIFAQNSNGQKRAWPIPTTSDTNRLVDKDTVRNITANF